MRVVVTGATGFVGRRLVPALMESGHRVTAMTRRPEGYAGPAHAVRGDATEPESLRSALAGCEIAYYLIHSLDHRDYVRRDARAAEAFGTAAAAAGVRRIIYLGGLGDPADPLSAHLRSRQQVEECLARAGVPVTTLRAGVVIGDQGTSWEIIRSLAARVPALAVPSWGWTRTQPVALADVVRYLLAVAQRRDEQNAVYEIGGRDVLRYPDLLSRAGAVEGRPVVVVPVLAPGVQLAALVAGRVLPLVAGVDGRTVRALVQSLRNDVVVRDDTIRQVVPFTPMGYDEAVSAALADRARRLRAG